jgi:hypothetical protein
MFTPMVGVAGLALDYAFVVKTKGELDNVALVAATNAATSARNLLNVAGTGSNRLDATAATEGQTVGSGYFTDQSALVKNASVTDKTVTVTRTGNTVSAKVTYSANVSTFIAKSFGVPTFSISGDVKRLVGMMDTTPTGSGAGAVVDENWVLPAGTSPQITDAATPVINDWYSGTKGTVSPLASDQSVTKPDGTPVTGSVLRVGNPDNSIAPLISKKVYLEQGSYELRYWYKSTVIYPDYDPTFVCGTVEKEMNWANADRYKLTSSARVTSGINTTQTSRAGVYLNPILTDPLSAPIPQITDFRPPPMPAPTSLRLSSHPNSGSPYSGQNRVDICAYSSSWIQRSIPIEVTAAGYFWLNFVSEPPWAVASRQSRTGFYLGPVQLCKGAWDNVKAASACSVALNNNWPWAANTVLYNDTFDESPPVAAAVNTTPGLNNFNVSRSVPSSSARYGSVPNWVTWMFGNGNPPSNLWTYENKSGNNIVRSNRLQAVIQRPLLLMPGTYKFEFKASQNENFPSRIWCSASEATFAGDRNSYVKSANGIWYLLDKNRGDGCACAAGYITTLVQTIVPSGQEAADIDAIQGTAPTGYKNPRGDSSIALSNCHAGNATSRNIGEFVCVLVPVTRYYAFRLAVAGPSLRAPGDAGYTTLDPAYTSNGFDFQLNTNGVYFDGLKVTLLSPGVKNKFTGTPASPGDFDTYASDCKTYLQGDVTSANVDNIINGGVPSWPGETTRGMNRVNVTAPKF